MNLVNTLKYYFSLKNIRMKSLHLRKQKSIDLDDRDFDNVGEEHSAMTPTAANLSRFEKKVKPLNSFNDSLKRTWNHGSMPRL